MVSLHHKTCFFAGGFIEAKQDEKEPKSVNGIKKWPWLKLFLDLDHGPCFLYLVEPHEVMNMPNSGD